MTLSAIPMNGAPTLCVPVPVLRELTPGARASMDTCEWSIRMGTDAGDTLSSNLLILRGNVHTQDNREEKQNQ